MLTVKHFLPMIFAGGIGFVYATHAHPKAVISHVQPSTSQTGKSYFIVFPKQ